MITRLLLRLPWYLGAPAIAAGAVMLAVGLNAIAGPYFERTFRDDADPLAGVGAALATVARYADAGAVTGSATAPVVSQEMASAPVAAAASAGMTDRGTVSPVEAPPAVGPVLVGEGTFVDGDPGHHGRGRARLIRLEGGDYVLRLEDFSVTNGPDLFVVLSTDPAGSRGSAAAADAVNLGRLKATDGNINYSGPEGLDLAGYRSVVIYCRAFAVVFAVATLEETS